MNWEAWKPLANLAFTTTLKFVGGFIVAHGLATQGPGLEALGGAATTAAGAFWSWWVQKGHTQAGDYLKKLTDTATQAAAIEVAKRMPIAAVTGAAASAKAEAKAIEPAVMAKDAAKAAIILAVLFASAFAFPGDARAQTRKLAPPAATGDFKADVKTDAQNLGLIPPSLQVTPTGNVAKDLQTLWEKIVTASTTDLTYASKLAAAANTPASAVRKQCWDAIIVINNQASGANLKNADGTQLAKPDPHAFMDVETLAEVVDNLSPSGPLFTACAGAAQLAKTNVLTFVNAVVTGAAGMAAMPVIPGL